MSLLHPIKCKKASRDEDETAGAETDAMVAKVVLYKGLRNQ